MNIIQSAVFIITLMISNGGNYKALAFSTTSSSTHQPSSSPPSARAIKFASTLPPLLSPNTKRFYFIRHGMTDWNKNGFVQGSSYDIPLNNEGRNQAAYAAEELSALPITCIASSHLCRASSTADEVYSYHHSTATRCIDEGFVEINYGELLEGKCIHNDNDEESRRLRDIFDQTSHDMESDLTIRYPGGGENAIEVEKRTRNAVQQLINDNSDDSRHLVVVGHGRSNKILLSSLLYNDASKFSTIEQGNTAISIVDYNMDDDTWMEVLINYVAHNEDRGAASGGMY